MVYKVFLLFLLRSKTGGDKSRVAFLSYMEIKIIVPSDMTEVNLCHICVSLYTFDKIYHSVCEKELGCDSVSFEELYEF